MPTVSPTTHDQRATAEPVCIRASAAAKFTRDCSVDPKASSALSPMQVRFAIKLRDRAVGPADPGPSNSRNKCSRRDYRCEHQPLPVVSEHERGLFLPVSCSQRAHEPGDCDPTCGRPGRHNDVRPGHPCCSSPGTAWRAPPMCQFQRDLGVRPVRSAPRCPGQRRCTWWRWRASVPAFPSR
jgi:hypothetical protein